MAQKVTYCRICECFCGLIAEVDGDRIVDIRGDPDHPMSRGHICIKGRALKELHHDPDRLRQPVKRAGAGKWDKLSWAMAIDEIAQQLLSVRDRHGPEAIAMYIGMGSFYSTLCGPTASAFIRSLGIGKVYSSMSIDCAAINRAAGAVFGEPAYLPLADWERARYMLVLGHNPLVSNFCQSQNLPRGLDAVKRARAAGGHLVIIDPRRTESRVVADEHHFIRPGTDLFLVLALLHTVIRENLADSEFVARYCDGFRQVSEVAEQCPPDKAAAATGISADTIRRLAKEFAAADAAFCIGHAGISQGPNPTLTEWAIFALNAITGNLDRPGGLRWNPMPKQILPIGRGNRVKTPLRQSRIGGFAKFLGELPSATLADEILAPGEGQVRALIVLGGDPLLSFPNGGKLAQAIEKLELLVSIDLYVNQTGAFAHYVLPAADQLERSEAHSPSATRNFDKPFLQCTPRIVEPLGDVWEEWRIFRQLARRLELPPFRNPLLEERVDKIEREGASADAMTRALLDEMLSPAGWSMAKLEEHRHGIVSGEPVFGLMRQNGWPTATGRVQLAPPEIIDGLRALEGSSLTAEREQRQFILIGRRVPANMNSGLRNLPSLVRAMPENTALINDQDAAQLGIAPGQRIVLYNQVGRISIPAQISKDILPGVVAIAHGWGHCHPSGQRLARQHPGVNPNILVDDRDLDPFTGSPRQNGTRVWLEASS